MLNMNSGLIANKDNEDRDLEVNLLREGKLAAPGILGRGAKGAGLRRGSLGGRRPLRLRPRLLRHFCCGGVRGGCERGSGAAPKRRCPGIKGQSAKRHTIWVRPCARGFRAVGLNPFKIFLAKHLNNQFECSSVLSRTSGRVLYRSVQLETGVKTQGFYHDAYNCRQTQKGLSRSRNLLPRSRFLSRNV